MAGWSFREARTAPLAHHPLSPAGGAVLFLAVDRAFWPSFVKILLAVFPVPGSARFSHAPGGGTAKSHAEFLPGADALCLSHVQAPCAGAPDRHELSHPVFDLAQHEHPFRHSPWCEPGSSLVQYLELLRFDDDRLFRAWIPDFVS